MQISGNATTADGAAADFVRAFLWPNLDLAGTAVPAQNGDWTIELTAEVDYGITYIAAGCQPITHGPYYVEGAGPGPLPTVIGEAFGGGFYAGDIEDAGQWYKLIVADVESDVYGLPWGGSGTNLTSVSNTNGLANTEAMRGNSAYEAGNHCLDWTGGGNADWYMPARDELNKLYINLGPSQPTCPDGFKTGQPQAFTGSAYYWCSTQYQSPYAWLRRFSNGNEIGDSKYSTARRVRPVRRLEFTPEP